MSDSKGDSNDKLAAEVPGWDSGERFQAGDWKDAPEAIPLHKSKLHISVDEGAPGKSGTAMSLYHKGKPVGAVTLMEGEFRFRGASEGATSVLDSFTAALVFFTEALRKMCDEALKGPGTVMTADTIKFHRQSSTAFYQDKTWIGTFAVEALYGRDSEGRWEPVGRELVFRGNMDAAATAWFEEHLKSVADSYMARMAPWGGGM